MYYDKYYPNMQSLLIPDETEHFALEHFTVTEKEAQHYTTMQAIRGNDGIEAGNYVRLIDKTKHFDSVIMSDTDMEKYTNTQFVEFAHGHVLIAGLGIGMIVAAILNKPEVKSIIIIEKEPEIIQLIGQQAIFQNSKICIIQADIFEYKTDQKFNTIYFDIWSNICTDNWEGMKQLKRKFLRNLDKQDQNAWMNCWNYEEIKYLIKTERRRGY